MLKKIVALAGFLFLTACAANGPKFHEKGPSQSENSLIYIYRPTRTINCCVSPKIYLDQAPKANLNNGGYAVYEVSAGQHQVIVGDGTYGFTAEKLNVTTTPGEAVYLKWVIGDLSQVDMMIVGALAVGSAKRDYHLIQIPKDKALPEISTLNLSQ